MPGLAASSCDRPPPWRCVRSQAAHRPPPQRSRRTVGRLIRRTGPRACGCTRRCVFSDRLMVLCRDMQDVKRTASPHVSTDPIQECDECTQAASPSLPPYDRSSVRSSMSLRSPSRPSPALHQFPAHRPPCINPLATLRNVATIPSTAVNVCIIYRVLKLLGRKSPIPPCPKPDPVHSSRARTRLISRSIRKMSCRACTKPVLQLFCRSAACCINAWPLDRVPRIHNSP